MTNKQNMTVTDDGDRDRYVTYQTREKALNDAILRADISENFERYLEIFDTFYADDVEVSSEPQNQPFRGKARVRSVLADFLVPLHIMVEIGGLLVSVRESPIVGDVSDETHSLWAIELVGVSGRTCTLNWRVARKWNGPYVVSEHHYDHQQTGGPLTSADLNSNRLSAISPFRKASGRDCAEAVKDQILRDGGGM